MRDLYISNPEMFEEVLEYYGLSDKESEWRKFLYSFMSAYYTGNFDAVDYTWAHNICSGVVTIDDILEACSDGSPDFLDTSLKPAFDFHETVHFQAICGGFIGDEKEI